jgi:4-hydroxybenzoate polyprenyltransferase
VKSLAVGRFRLSQEPEKGMIAQAIGLIRTMRVRQWIKNGFIFVPLVFDRKLTDLMYVSRAVAGFFLLCLVTSAVYIINDLVDIEADRAHPTKRRRPLPSGALSPIVATVAAVLLLLVSLPLALALNPVFAAILAGYLLLQIAYSFYLKHVVLLDVMALAAGYLLRVGAGAELIEAERFSPWLYIFTGMLALFLGIAKRRQELVLLADNENKQRAILDEYDIGLLDEMILIVTASTVLTYALYTFSAEGLPPNHTMMLTIPFVVYGIFRYLFLIHVRGEGGAPDEVILKDRPLQIAVLLWGFAVILVLYVLA